MPASFIDTWTALWSIESIWWTVGIFFVAALVEMWFPPFPGDAVFFIGLATMSAKEEPVFLAITAACVGGFAGFAGLYWLGSIKGRHWFARRENGLVSRHTLHRIETWISHWGGWVIIGGRFLVGIRSAVPLVAGVGSYPRNHALIFGAVSIVIWNGLLATGALVLGQNWGAVSRILSTYNKVFWTLGGIVLLILAIRFFLQKRRGTKSGTTQCHL